MYTFQKPTFQEQNAYPLIRTFLSIIVLNEREEFKQETQHTQQTATRKAQNQDKKTEKATKTQKTHRNKQTFIKGKMGVPPWNGQ